MSTHPDFSEIPEVPYRFIGLDVHKYYLIAIGVDADLNQVLGPQRVQLSRIEEWIQKTLSPGDAVVLEMTANSWHLHDDLAPFVHSVTIVHPPHVALITRAQVMTDKVAASHLARLHAKGLLVGVWVPPPEIRDLRGLVAQRQKMTWLKVAAKNRLHAVLHRHHFPLPEEGALFAPEIRDWWLALPVDPLERMQISSDLDTLTFSMQQIKQLEDCMAQWAARNEDIPWLIQMTGIGLVSGTAILAAVGDITRFPSAKQLVGYAGLGARVHESGITSRRGKITKAGRKDLRTALVECAHVAVIHDPHWKKELERLEPRLGYNKTIVAIARKMLVVIWHLLAKREVDRLAVPERLAKKYLEFAYRIGKANRPKGQTAAEYVRAALDMLGVGQEMTFIPRGRSKFKLPPSKLALKGR